MLMPFKDVLSMGGGVEKLVAFIPAILINSDLKSFEG